jgi:predicted small lipoprotein YifL
MRVPAVLLAALAAALGAGCGQKGPLYLRESPPHGQKPFKPEPYQPVPYPPREGEDAAPAKK